MTDIDTARLTLHPVDLAEARRIRAQDRSAQDHWADDYPFDGDLRAVGAFVAASERSGEQRPFGYYQVIRRSDGQAIGGIGFKGPPDDDGVAEVGYGLASSARGHGYAAEALTALLTAAARLGATKVRADTACDNDASRRTLERAGFGRVEADADLLYYELGVCQSFGLKGPAGTRRGQRGLLSNAADVDELSVTALCDGRLFSLRWVLLHLVEETVRHAGRPDLLREAIDGAVGE